MTRVAIVTGGSGGVGQGIVFALARAGFAVGVNYYDTPDAAQQTVDEVARLGSAAWAVQADVRRADQVQRMVADAVERYGQLDVFVNNAGVQTWKPLLDVTEDEWDFVIDTNLKGCFLCTQAAARVMKERGGAIINIGSGCNKIGFPTLAAYTASKGGIEMFTKVSAIELGPHKIRVNCVAPGAIEIERTRLEIADYAGTWGKVTPLRRIGYPDDIGRAVAFFASDESAFVTGQTIWVDGGLFSQPPWSHT